MIDDAATQNPTTHSPDFEGTPRPGRRPWHATTELDHFLIVTYRVPTDALQTALPREFTPEKFVFDDATGGSLVSAVPFLDRHFRFRGMPLISLSCGQVNYRAYVTYEGRKGVFFFGTSLDSALVRIPQVLWRMPWHGDRVEVSESSGIVRFSATGAWGAGKLEARITPEVLGRLDGFADAFQTAEILTHPMIGWYQRTGETSRKSTKYKLGSYQVWHCPVEARICEPTHSSFAVFEDLGLITSGQIPHSVLYQPSIHFDVLMPPRKLILGGSSS